MENVTETMYQLSTLFFEKIPDANQTRQCIALQVRYKTFSFQSPIAQIFIFKQFVFFLLYLPLIQLITIYNHFT